MNTMTEAFKKIEVGLKEAIAHRAGDPSKGKVVSRKGEKQPTHVKTIDK